MFDASLVLRSAGAGSLTATETGSAVTIGETPAGGLACFVAVPAKSVGDTMQVTLQESTDSSAWATFLTFALVASVTEVATGPFRFIRRFATRAKYIRHVTTVAGTSPDFGAVQILIGDRDWANNFKITPAATGDEV